MFPTDYDSIIARIAQIEPSEYAKSRNFINGKVSYLSPYISRGVISTRQVWQTLQSKGMSIEVAEKFVQELAWRDYFQRVWQHLGDNIYQDIKQRQEKVKHYALPSAVLQAKTGIEAIDISIQKLYETGYMHNHCRMYTAFLACNVAQSHWLQPAKWLYYHLLDADWASNACSWQWVAGTFSSKKYVANQENINKYTHSAQNNSYLSVDYAQIDNLPIPPALQKVSAFDLTTELPKNESIVIDNTLPTFLYNFYQLDPLWHKGEAGNRILLLEPSHFEAYPISPKSLQFMLNLAKNIQNIQVYVGEFATLKTEFDLQTIHFKEHPLTRHYTGLQSERDWLFPAVSGYFPSFFAYWKKCQQYLS